MAEIPAQLRAALAERYAIQHELGRGGMATVYLAEDRKHGRLVAIKVLSPDAAHSVGPERFLREIATTARLDHPHILPLLDSGTADGILYYVMPYVEGETLRDRMRREGKLPLDDALRITREVADALAYAHAHGVVHRDIKPENILLGGDHARVADFGIAWARGAGSEHLTATGVAVGTPVYMSPEHALGLTELDGRSDLYSLGCVLFEMLAGQPPHSGPSAQAVLAKRLVEPATSVSQLRPDVPAWVDAALRTALARDPADRFSSPTGLIRALGVTGTSSVVPGSERPRSRARLVGALGVLVLTTVAVVLLVQPADGGSALSLGATRSVTFEPGMEVDVALSPDGQTLAYAARDPDVDAMRIYVRSLSGGNAIAISSEARGGHRMPRWSPDGSQIMFTALGVPHADGSTSTNLVVVPTLGGPPRDLVIGAQWGAWSPDGTAITYTRLGEGLFVQRIGGAEQRLVPSGTTVIHSPSWSPDGKWVAYVSGNPDHLTMLYGNLGPSALRLVPAEGGTSWSVTDMDHLHTSPAWLPDSRGLLLVSDRDGASDIHLLRLGADGRSRGLTRLTTDLGVGQVTVAPDGSRLGYVLVTTKEANVWRLPLSDRRVVSVRQAEQVTTGSQNVEAMSVSPDGASLAYDSDRAGNSDIYTMRLPDGAPVRMTTDAANEFYPVWSPDGASLAFVSWRSGDRDIYVMSAGAVGEATPVVADSGQDFRMTWAPDSRGIAFVSNRSRTNQGYELFITERGAGDGWTAPRRLGEAYAFEPKWSPSGQSIAYFGAPDLSLRLIAPDGTGDRLLLTREFTHGGLDYRLVTMTQWTRDSRALYVRALDPSGGTVFFRLTVATGALQPIATLNDPDRPPPGGRWEFAADDRYIYVTLARRQSDIRVAEIER